MNEKELTARIAELEARADGLSVAGLDELALSEFREIKGQVLSAYRMLPQNDEQAVNRLQKRLNGVLVALVCIREHWTRLKAGQAA